MCSLANHIIICKQVFADSCSRQRIPVLLFISAVISLFKEQISGEFLETVVLTNYCFPFLSNMPIQQERV